MTTDAERSAEAPRRRRGRRAVVIALLVVVLFLPAALAGALWLRLGAGPVALPAPLAARVEARLDAAMAANTVRIGRIEVSRPDGWTEIGLVLRDVRLSDPDGATRAAFPTLSVDLSGEALMQGRVHPIRIGLVGAGLRLARDADGQIDLALTAGETASELSLAETLARLDAMFAAPEFAELEAVQGSGLRLVMADAMTGQLMQVSDARLRLVRGAGALSLTMGGALEGSRDATLDIALTRSSESGTTNLGFAFAGLAARDVATIGPAMAWLDLMRAPISGHFGGALMEDGSVGDLQVSLDIGAGRLRMADDAAPLGFERVQAAMRYDAETRRIDFDRLELSAPALSFTASGHADADADGNRYTGQFLLADIVAEPGNLYAEPLRLDGAALDLRLTLSPTIEIEVGQATIHDEGLEVRARGRVAAREAGFEISVDASLPEGEVQQILPYWPVSAAARTREWLAANLFEGRLTGVDFALRAAAADPPEYALGFDFEGVRLRAVQSLPPIEDGAGYLSLVGPRLVLRLDEGVISVPGGGALALDGSTMTVDDTRVRGPDARLSLATAGELADLLRLLEEPPVRLFSEGPMTAERIGSGGAEMRAEITTRLARQEDMGDTRFAVTGQVTGFRSDTLLPGRLLSADALQVEAGNDAVRISGRARFDGVPLTGQWSRALGPGADPVARVDARALLSRETLAALGVDLPGWLLSGETEAALSLRLPPNAAPELELRSDLSGVALSLPPLGWGIGPATQGALEVDMRLGESPAVTALRLDAPGLDLVGRASLRAGGGLDRLSAERFRLGGWLDVSGALLGRGPGRSPAIEVTGGTVDLRGAPQGRATGGGVGGGGPLSLTLDRLQVSEGIALTALVADMTSEGGLSGQFRGRVNGDAPVSGTLVTTQTGPAVRVLAEDGGAVLRSAGVFRSAHGGAMNLVLSATGAEGTYDGTLTIENPRLRDAPVMAELLNLVSVVGLIEQLSGEGINLGDVEARFRLTPQQVILTEGTALGAALGVSMDGTYSLGSRQLDMAGVISPFNAVNGLFGALLAPRREGLFGFAYRLTGSSENPQVTVNPLSILTPGVFREIFRRPPPDLSGAP